ILVATAPGLMTAMIIAVWSPSPARLRALGWTLVAVSTMTTILVVATNRLRPTIEKDPPFADAYFTTSVPFIPARKWPGKLQRNVYVPGAVGALNVTSADSPGPTSVVDASTFALN